MIVAGLLARFPKLAKDLPFKKAPKAVKLDKVVAFSGRPRKRSGEPRQTTRRNFATDSAPSEKQWAALFKDKSILILLDELAFISFTPIKGKKDEGERFSTLTALALTNLFAQSATTRKPARSLSSWPTGTAWTRAMRICPNHEIQRPG